MQNIVQKLHKKIFSGCTIEVSAVITNNKNAPGKQKAADLGVRCEILPHTDFESRESFDAALVDLIRGFSPDLTVLAGFMRILTPVFTDNIAAINIHAPSVLFAAFSVYALSGYGVYAWRKAKGVPTSVIALSKNEPDEQSLHSGF